MCGLWYSLKLEINGESSQLPCDVLGINACQETPIDVVRDVGHKTPGKTPSTADDEFELSGDYS